MAVEYRKDRKKWGYRVYLAGRCFKKYAWDTKREAREAEREFLVEIKKNPPPPKNTLTAVASQYLIESARKGRSKWRLDGLRWNFNKFTLPFFGENTVVTTIKRKDVEEFVLAQKQRGVKNKTIWNYVTDLRAMFNWALKEGLVVSDPVSGADLDPIRNRKPHKPPLKLEDVELAASVLEGYDRVYFDFMRYTGLRKDEANRVRWEDVDLVNGWLHVPGTKTEESDAIIPLAPALRDELVKHLRENPGSEYLFFGRSAQTKGRKIYSRRRLFEKITGLTGGCGDCRRLGRLVNVKVCITCGVVVHRNRCSKCGPAGAVIKKQRCGRCGSENIQSGVKLKPKDMRDIFATEVADRVSNPDVMRRLLRHTNLTTTTKYMRMVNDRMREAVKGLGAVLGGGLNSELGPKTTQNDLSGVPVQMGVIARDLSKKVGGGGGTRTLDSADMSRVL